MLCKPPRRCRMETLKRRFYHGKEEPNPGGKRAESEDPRAAAAGKYRQHIVLSQNT